MYVYNYVYANIYIYLWYMFIIIHPHIVCRIAKCLSNGQGPDQTVSAFGSWATLFRPEVHLALVAEAPGSFGQRERPVRTVGLWSQEEETNDSKDQMVSILDMLGCNSLWQKKQPHNSWPSGATPLHVGPSEGLPDAFSSSLHVRPGPICTPSAQGLHHLTLMVGQFLLNLGGQVDRQFPKGGPTTAFAVFGHGPFIRFW